MEIARDRMPPQPATSASFTARAASALSAGEVVAAQEVHADVLEEQRPERDRRTARVRGVGGHRTANGQQFDIGRDVCAERHLDDVMDSVRCQRPDTFDQILPSLQDLMCAGLRRWLRPAETARSR